MELSVDLGETRPSENLYDAKAILVVWRVCGWPLRRRKELVGGFRVDL